MTTRASETVIALAAVADYEQSGRRRTRAGGHWLGWFRFSTLTLGALVLLLLATASSASAASETAGAGNIVASFHDTGTYFHPRNARLTISWSGRVIYSQPVRSKWCANQCWPDTFVAGNTALHVVRLQAGALPEVVLDLYSGGAHCCFIDQVFSVVPASLSVRKSEINFGDPGARLVPIGAGRSSDFLTADDSFAYAFTDFAASGMPIEVLSFSHYGFHDVTKSFPTLIVTDARKWQEAFRAMASSHYHDTVGVVAAWAADEDRLRRVAVVSRFLALEVKAGHLNSAMNPTQRSGERYVAELHQFLLQHGYLK